MNLSNVFSPAEERALRLLMTHGSLTVALKTDGDAGTIHGGVAESLVRKGLVVVRYRGEARTAALTDEGRATCGVAASAAPSGGAADAVAHLAMNLVYPNPKQPRTIFEEGPLEELAASIREHGLLQPIKVRPDGQGRYMIVLGERRWRAHQRIGAATIFCCIVAMSDDDLADAAIVENLQRRDITPLEEARAFQARLSTGISVDDLARRLGIKQPRRIAERVALLRLSLEFQDALARGMLSPSQAGEMSRLSTSSQHVLFRAIRDGRCRTYAELRSVAQGLLDAENQTELLPGDAKPTEDEQRAVHGLERKIERVCEIVRAGFDDNDVVILRKVNPLNADVMADKLDVIEASLKKLRLALRAAAVAGGARGSQVEAA
jgi:ParB family chromosome partitioning protein